LPQSHCSAGGGSLWRSWFRTGLAWISHFFVEHSRPATFEHPLWSWWADLKMVALMLTGKMSEEVRRCGLEIRKPKMETRKWKLENRNSEE